MEHIASQLMSPHISRANAQPLTSPYDSQLLNEIMPLIYKRFTDKAAEEWRQIYKVRYASHHWRKSVMTDHRILSVYLESPATRIPCEERFRTSR